MKRLMAITIAAVMLILPLQAAAGAEGPLSYERGIALMNLNNGTLKKLQRAESDALQQYRSNVEQAKTIDTKGFTIKYGDQEMFIYYDDSMRTMMTKVKELYPEQMKFSWEASRDNRIINTYSFQTGLRGIFFGVYNAQADLQLKQKQLAFAVEVNRQDKLKLENGMISSIDLQESDYNLLKAQKDADRAKRSYDNAVRNFNQFVGLPSGTQFTQIIYEDVLAHSEWKPVDYYIEKALANRFDITSLRRQMDLKEQEKKIIESGYTYKVSTTAQDEYERLKNDMEQLALDIDGMGLVVINEIKDAYVDVISAGKGVDNLNNTLQLQRKSYANMQARYKAGMISKNNLTQAELGLLQVENGYKAALYDYNTRIMRFNNATGIGPGY